MNEDLLEALDYFSDDVQTLATAFEESVTMGSMSLSNIQKLLSPDKVDQNMSKSVGASDISVQQDEEEPSSLRKRDRRRRPYSTSKRHNRKRPKHELDYLRAKVVELQKELAIVGKAEMSVVRKNVPLAMIQTTSGLSSWKATAAYQRHEVAMSIDENRKLRKRWLYQLQVARVLKAAIQQHQSEVATSSHEFTYKYKSLQGETAVLVDEPIRAQRKS